MPSEVKHDRERGYGNTSWFVPCVSFLHAPDWNPDPDALITMQPAAFDAKESNKNHRVYVL